MDAKEQEHRLTKVDDWVRYDQHLAEKNHLFSAKNEAENDLIKTLIQLSSAVILIVPSFFGNTIRTGSTSFKYSYFGPNNDSFGATIRALEIDDGP